MSNRWASLRREIELLRKQFLPARFNPLGVYGKGTAVQAQTRAFIVLSHAEIEAYLEGWAKELLGTSERIWTRSGRVALPLGFLLSWNADRLTFSELLSTPGARDSHQNLGALVTRLFQAYYERIKANHGLKERNVLALFGPLGIPGSAFPPTLLPGLDSLGARRGLHAHQSRTSVRTVLDPETEYTRIVQVIQDLQVFDRWLTGFRMKLR